MGRPAIGASGFPGKRDDARRAGITASTRALEVFGGEECAIGREAFCHYQQKTY
jgi:hypothetical protein